MLPWPLSALLSVLMFVHGFDATGEMEGLRELCTDLIKVAGRSKLVADEACLVHGDYKVWNGSRAT